VAALVELDHPDILAAVRHLRGLFAPLAEAEPVLMLRMHELQRGRRDVEVAVQRPEIVARALGREQAHLGEDGERRIPEHTLEPASGSLHRRAIHRQNVAESLPFRAVSELHERNLRMQGALADHVARR
jgi:hypothetical protein